MMNFTQIASRHIQMPGDRVPRTCGQSIKEAELAFGACEVNASCKALEVSLMPAAVDGDPSTTVWSTQAARADLILRSLDIGEHQVILKREDHACTDIFPRPLVDPDGVETACWGPIQQITVFSEQLAHFKLSHWTSNNKTGADFKRIRIAHKSHSQCHQMKVLIHMQKLIYLSQ